MEEESEKADGRIQDALSLHAIAEGLRKEIVVEDSLDDGQ